MPLSFSHDYFLIQANLFPYPYTTAVVSQLFIIDKFFHMDFSVHRIARAILKYLKASIA